MPKIVRPPDGVQCMMALRHQNKTSVKHTLLLIKKPQFVLWISFNKPALVVTTTFQRISIHFKASVSIQTVVISLLVLTPHSAISHPPPYTVLTLSHIHCMHYLYTLEAVTTALWHTFIPISSLGKHTSSWAAITSELLQCNNAFANLFLRHPPAIHPNKKFIYRIEWILLWSHPWVYEIYFCRQEHTLTCL